MKRTLFLLLFNLICLLGFSQSNIRLNNYWENTYYINPASIYSEYQFVVSGAIQKQWLLFPGAPITGYFTAVEMLNTKKNTQIGHIGLKLFSDKIGFTSLLSISSSYSYSVRLNKSLLMNLGIAYKIQSFSYDMTKANLATPNDPATYNNETRWLGHNADLGVEFVGRSLLVGVSSQNLMSLFTQGNTLQTNANFLYVMNRTPLDNTFYVQSGVCAIQNENLSQLEFNISTFFSPSNHPNFLQFGMIYRTSREYGIIFGLDLGNSLRLAYTYDYDFAGIRHSSIGSQEMMLTWKFGKLPDCKCRELFK